MPQPFRLIAAALAGLLLTATPVLARIQVEAARGVPFGVAKVTISPVGGDASKLVLNNGFGLDDPDGRMLYPVFVPGKFAQFLNNLLKPEEAIEPNTLTLYFLFRGDDPFAGSLYTPRKEAFRVVPGDRPSRLHARLLEEWWREYRRVLRTHDEEGAYPKNLDAYLEASLAHRLGLQLDPVSDKKKRDGASQSSLHLLIGSEQAKADLIHGAFGLTRSEVMTLEPPPGILFEDPPAPLPGGEAPAEPVIDIEAIAGRTPRECFYVHFGRFNHFLWLSDLLQEYGGDIGRMAVLRGQSKSMNEQIERRLGVKQNALAKLLGESVVQDIAIIGRDAFFDEGPAMGVLLHAKNNLLLTTDLQRQRNEAFARERARGATEQERNPDPRPRRLADEHARPLLPVDLHFRRRFSPHHHLARNRAAIYRNARRRRIARRDGRVPGDPRYPTSRKDTVFAYFSSYFFQGLLSPQYQIEQRRRLTSLVEMEMLNLARLAAKAEKSSASAPEELIASGFLPDVYGRRVDGSVILETENGLGDSLRGARGSFLPITDTPLEGVSSEELAFYEQLEREWRGRQLDPLVVTLRHEHGPAPGIERLHLDARLSLLDREKYKVILDAFGPPTKTAITRPQDDIVHVQAVLTGNPLLKSEDVSHLVLGVKDLPPLEKLRPEGLLRVLDFIRSTPGYLAAWPRTGLLALFPIRLGPEATTDGLQRLLFGVWRLRSGELTAFSFDPSLLERLPSQIAPVEMESAAQVRIEVDDLSKTQLSGWINAVSFERARQTSMANIKAMHWVSQQLQIPRAQSREFLEQYVGARLVCVLGGEYTLTTAPSGLEYWETSAAAAAKETERPADYQAPFLAWFRGLRMEGTMEDSYVQLHGFVDLMRKETPQQPSAPSFWDLLNGAPKPAKAEEIPPPLPKAPPAEAIPPPPASGKRAF